MWDTYPNYLPYLPTLPYLSTPIYLPHLPYPPLPATGHQGPEGGGHRGGAHQPECGHGADVQVPGEGLARQGTFCLSILGL